MSDADRLFKETGYKTVEEDIFDSFWLVYFNEEKQTAISFNLVHNYFSIDDDGGYGINMQELKAINKKCEELRME